MSLLPRSGKVLDFGTNSELSRRNHISSTSILCQSRPIMASKSPFRIPILSRSTKQFCLSCSASVRNPRLLPGPARIQSSTGAHFSVLQTKSYATTASSFQLLKDTQAASQTTGGSLDQELQRAARILEITTAPNEQDVQDALQMCENQALKFAEPNGRRSASPTSDKGPTSNLLSMDDRAAQSLPAEAPKVASSPTKTAKKISAVAYSIIKDPKVFVTPRLLATYVNTQTILGQPQSFPHVFDLYASKTDTRAWIFANQVQGLKPQQSIGRSPSPSCPVRIERSHRSKRPVAVSKHYRNECLRARFQTSQIHSTCSVSSYSSYLIAVSSLCIGITVFSVHGFGRSSNNNELRNCRYCCIHWFHGHGRNCSYHNSK